MSVSVPGDAIEAARSALRHHLAPYGAAQQPLITRVAVVAAAPFIAAQALRDAADALWGADDDFGMIVQSEAPVQWLRDRADRIERGES